MGLYDRGYMKDPDGGRAFKAAPRGKPASSDGLAWWQRLRFKLWLAFHPRRPTRKSGEDA